MNIGDLVKFKKTQFYTEYLMVGTVVSITPTHVELDHITDTSYRPEKVIIEKAKILPISDNSEWTWLNRHDAKTFPDEYPDYHPSSLILLLRSDGEPFLGKWDYDYIYINNPTNDDEVFEFDWSDNNWVGWKWVDL